MSLLAPEEKFTRQGVRDLGDIRQRRRVRAPRVLPPYCTHPRMQPCCGGPGIREVATRDPHLRSLARFYERGLGCGHLHCPDCGLSWDSYSEH